MLDLHGLTKEEIEEFSAALTHLLNEKMKREEIIDELSEYPPKQEIIVQPKPDYVKFHSRWGR